MPDIANKQDAVFEGVEKRIEINFEVPDGNFRGLRGIDRVTWDEICSRCKCEIVHHEEQDHFDSYILSESSLFVFPTKVMMKTCGTTLPLDSADLIVREAMKLGLKPLELTYSRGNYLFPDLQLYPHNCLKSELEHLAKMEIAGCAIPGKSCILGDASGKHWFVHRKVWDVESSIDTPDHRQTAPMQPDVVLVDVVMTGLSDASRSVYYKNG